MNWDLLPELLLLHEVVALTREKISTAYLKLSQARYPIACLPNVRPYRFPKKHVRAYIEEGRATNRVVVLQAHRRRRRPAVRDEVSA